MNWDDLTHDFNLMFEGQILERGMQPRPHRSKSSLITERYRIPFICQIAGLTPKDQKKPPAKKPAAKKPDDKSKDGKGGKDGKDPKGGKRK